MHYVEVPHDAPAMCEGTVRAVRAMNAYLDAGLDAKPRTELDAQLESEKTQNGTGAEPSVPSATSEVRPAASEAAGGGRALLGEPEGRPGNAWGGALAPEQIARNGAEFIRGHVRMRDVRLYARDALLKYASLQRFRPRPLPGVSLPAGVQAQAAVRVPVQSRGREVRRVLEASRPRVLCRGGRRRAMRRRRQIRLRVTHTKGGRA